MLRIGYPRQVAPPWLGGTGVALTIRALGLDTFCYVMVILTDVYDIDGSEFISFQPAVGPRLQPASMVVTNEF